MRKPRNRFHRFAAFAPLTLGFGAVLGCFEQQSFSDDAIGHYLDRHGLKPAAAGPDGVPIVVPSLPEAPATARRIALTIVSARDLPDLDPGPGVTDPYVLVQIDGQRQRTTVIEGSLNPVWGDSFIIEIGPSPVLELTLRDEDGLSSDETIGIVSRVLDPIVVGRSIEYEIPFRDGAGGYLTIRMTGLAPRDVPK